MQERTRLPFRKTTEGYFLDDNGLILAQDSGKGYLLLPGGGVDDAEDIEKAMLREVLEETQAVVVDLVGVGVVRVVWGTDWPKTVKQHARYELFQGDEMHFFKGRVERFEKGTPVHEDRWEGKLFMKLDEAIRIIESKRPFEKSVGEYREKQLCILRELNNV